MSASEKLKTLDWDGEGLIRVLQAYDQIVAVVEATEVVNDYFASIGWTSDGLAQLAPALTALEERLAE